MSQTETKAKERTPNIEDPTSQAASLRSTSSTSHASNRTVNLVRIVGKNGQESFVELPFLPRTSRSVSAARPEIQSPRQEPAATDPAKEKKKRDATAERKAKHLREERTAADAMEKKKRDDVTHQDAERLREERFAAEAMMHGALPASSTGPPVARSVKQSRSSSRKSEQQTPWVFDTTSPPPSVASSKTSVPKSASVRETSPRGDFANGSQARSKQSSVAGWQEVRFGTYEPAASSREKSRSPRDTTRTQPKAAPRISFPPAYTDYRPTPAVAAASKPESFQYSCRHRSNTQKPSTKYNDVGRESAREAPRSEHTESRTSSMSVDSFPLAVPQSSAHSTFHPWQQSDIGLRPDMQGPTVFAGRGWISPHPLSEAPTWAREEPDPEIQLPTGAAIRTESGVQTMTYEEWLAVQKQTNSTVGSRVAGSNARSTGSATQNRLEARREEVRDGTGCRNISVTKSHASRPYAGGSCGVRAGEPFGQGNYRAPTVEAESAAGGRQQSASQRGYLVRDASSAVIIQDEDGNAKTWLEMPWDKEGSRKSDKGNGFPPWF